LNLSLVDWGLKFIKSATAKQVNNAAVPLKDIAVFSQREYKKWTALPGFDFSFEHKGMLEIFQTQKVADHALHTYHHAKELGLEVDLLNKEALQALEPQTTINAIGAIYFKCDSHLHPDKLMVALKKYLSEKGVVFIPNEAVTGFEKQGNKVIKVLANSKSYACDEVVVATGSWSREIAAMLDTKVPLMPGRGYSFTLTDSRYKINHPAILTEGRVAITPFKNGQVRFGGTMEVVSTKTPVRHKRVEGIIKAVKSFLPEFDIPMPEAGKIWSGFRPCSADGLPYIGRVKNYKNVVVATGHAMLGLSLGAGTGKLVSELVDEVKTSVDLKPFAVERFG
jgi:D-amino-acid dehydrogenase